MSEELFKTPVLLKSHGPARIISVCNQKGGVGKTTTTINLAAGFAHYGRKVLIVDLDPQGAASVALKQQTATMQKTIYDCMLNEVSINSVIVKTNEENLYLAPANIDLSAAELQLVNEVARESVLARVLKDCIDDFDVILIDCQPSLGLLTVNALTASHGVLIPLEAEYFALRGAALLVDTIKKVSNRLNPTLKIDGILITMFDSRTLHSKEVLQQVEKAFSKEIFKTLIHRTVKFPDSSVAGMSVIKFDPNHKASAAYLQLAREIISRGDAA